MTGRRVGAGRPSLERARRPFGLVLAIGLLTSGCGAPVAGQPTIGPLVSGAAAGSSGPSGGASPSRRPISAEPTGPSPMASSSPPGTGTGASTTAPTTGPASAEPSTTQPATTEPTTTQPGTAATTVHPVDLRRQHDTVLLAVLRRLQSSLQGGRETAFLESFTPGLRPRVGHWFRNTVALGVDSALFAPTDDYSSGATDAATSFTRTVVLGVRTPYDDPGSMPGIPYLLTVSTGPTRGWTTPVVTSWQPKYLDDPMNCDCTLDVVHSATAAVVSDAADRDLAFWSASALAAAGGIRWADEQLAGSGLVIPRGSVVFLADKPFRWFLALSGPAQHANLTAGMIDALGAYPGTRYSDQSRIVLMLQASDGSVVPNNDKGRLYAGDVLTHESTHQLMNRNSTLPERSANSPPTWVVEGIAVAVETLHRDSRGSTEDVGYPDPNDPKNIDSDWFRSHLRDRMPTSAELYSSAAAGYYAIAGSVFRYLAEKYGYVQMMRIAAAMYRKPAQTPFDYFPDPDHQGEKLSAATAQDRWHAWFVGNYE